MLPAQVVFLAASGAVLAMASDGLWAAATLHPGIAILAAIQARIVIPLACLWRIGKFTTKSSIDTLWRCPRQSLLVQA